MTDHAVAMSEELITQDRTIEDLKDELAAVKAERDQFAKDSRRHEKSIATLVDNCERYQSTIDELTKGSELYKDRSATLAKMLDELKKTSDILEYEYKLAEMFRKRVIQDRDFQLTQIQYRDGIIAGLERDIEELKLRQKMKEDGLL